MSPIFYSRCWQWGFLNVWKRTNEKTGHSPIFNHMLNPCITSMLQLSCSAAAALSEERYMKTLSQNWACLGLAWECGRRNINLIIEVEKDLCVSECGEIHCQLLSLRKLSSKTGQYILGLQVHECKTAWGICYCKVYLMHFREKKISSLDRCLNRKAMRATCPFSFRQLDYYY